MWKPPDVLDLFERHMGWGLEELEENPRYTKVAEGFPEESPADIANLVVHILASHASAGFAAAEATLSESAMTFLRSEARLPLDEVEEELTKLKNEFLPPEPPEQTFEVPEEWGPVLKGGACGIGVGVVVGVVANKIYFAALSSTILGFVAAVGVGLGVWNARKEEDRCIVMEKCADVVEEKPSAIIAFLKEALKSAVQHYEKRINEIAATRSKEPI